MGRFVTIAVAAQTLGLTPGGLRAWLHRNKGFHAPESEWPSLRTPLVDVDAIRAAREERPRPDSPLRRVENGSRYD
jgi:hypothetical protein